MSQQIFDPNMFLEITVDQPFEDRIPLPVGEYTAMVGQITARSWQSKDGTPGLPGTSRWLWMFPRRFSSSARAWPR